MFCVQTYGMCMFDIRNCMTVYDELMSSSFALAVWMDFRRNMKKKRMTKTVNTTRNAKTKLQFEFSGHLIRLFLLVLSHSVAHKIAEKQECASERARGGINWKIYSNNIYSARLETLFSQSVFCCDSVFVCVYIFFFSRSLACFTTR